MQGRIFPSFNRELEDAFAAAMGVRYSTPRGLNPKTAARTSRYGFTPLTRLCSRAEAAAPSNGAQSCIVNCAISYARLLRRHFAAS